MPPSIPIAYDATSRHGLRCESDRGALLIKPVFIAISLVAVAVFAGCQNSEKPLTEIPADNEPQAAQVALSKSPTKHKINAKIDSFSLQDYLGAEHSSAEWQDKQAGEYEYKFVLDGKTWKTDPPNYLHRGMYQNSVVRVK